MENVYLVSCSNRKLPHAAPAKELYTSPTFQAARRLAELRGSTWFIVSAKHGILTPDTHIEPYDVALTNLSYEDRSRWTRTVTEAIRELIPLNSETTILADDFYAEQLTPRLRQLGYPLRLPFLGRRKETHLLWLTEVLDGSVRSSHLDRLYELLGVLSEGLGGLQEFDEVTADMNWPHRGVYFFFEDSEKRFFHESIQRVTRVGTHAVSKGSKSTLWQRLRTHRGTSLGEGGHRSSILRLHIGTALMAKSPERFTVSTWGQGQTADRQTREAEKQLEEEVSRYIRKMKLLWLSIGDSPSPASDRSYIERNTIALLSGPVGPIDFASASWLGTYCVNPAVKKSSLWNVDFVDDIYDSRFLDVFSKFVDITLGRIALPLHSIAPEGWYRTGGAITNPNQTHLFNGDVTK